MVVLLGAGLVTIFPILKTISKEIIVRQVATFTNCRSVWTYNPISSAISRIATRTLVRN